MSNILDTYHNHSGGAIGADSTFDLIGKEFGFNNHHHYWYKKMNPLSKLEDELSSEEYNEGVEKINIANKTLKRFNIEKYMHLLARNWMQVKNAEAIYAIGFLKGFTMVDGGTGWAVQMSIDSQKSTFVFDQDKIQWHWFNGKKFECCSTPILTNHYAGIGTRKINEYGIGAIRNVYVKTLKSLNLL